MDFTKMTTSRSKIISDYLCFVGLAPIEKNFYIEDPEVGAMHPDYAQELRY